MILGVFGLPGMGKSTFLTKFAQVSMHGKKFMGISPHDRVFTNFECEGCYKLDFDKLGIYNFSDCLILIDEIMMLADCRNFKTFGENLKYFFSHHRHYNVDVVWCSQYYTDCDCKIRALTQRYYLLEKSKILPISYVKPIYRILGVSDGTVSDIYDLGGFFTWKTVWRPKYYGMFDSYSRKDLKPLELELWKTSDDEPGEAVPAATAPGQLPGIEKTAC